MSIVITQTRIITKRSAVGKPQRAQQQPRRQTRQQQQAYRAPQQVERVQQDERRTIWRQHRARDWQAEHRSWQQRGGYRGYRIPEARYRLYFGPSHRFRIYSLPLVTVGGYPCFQYSGFWFSLVEPWPTYWSEDWYDTDDVYIYYAGDGYYLYDPRYPRDQIAISVYLNVD